MPQPWHWLTTLMGGLVLFASQRLASTGRGGLVLAATGGLIVTVVCQRLFACRRSLARWLVAVLGKLGEEQTAGGEVEVSCGPRGSESTAAGGGVEPSS